jgi:hypothetical protein
MPPISKGVQPAVKCVTGVMKEITKGAPLSPRGSFTTSGGHLWPYHTEADISA